MTSRLPRPVLLVLACALLATLAVPALAATRNGVRPVAPKAGASLDRGERVTFRGRVRGKGAVWVYVCKSRKRNADGLICSSEVIEKAKRVGKRGFRVRPKFFDYPDFWLNSPGTYYWQAHRLRCEGGTRDCAQEGPVVKLRVG